MVNPQQSTIEMVLGTALAFMSKGNPGEAQNLLGRAKMAAQQQGLETLVDAANRNLAISHQMQARVKYDAGNLESSAEKYQEAAHAFTEFDASFKTPDERNTLAQWLSQLFPYWADTYGKLADRNHVLGNKQLTEAAAKGPDKKGILNGLKTWDAALGWYRATIKVCENATGKGIQVDEGYRTLSQQKIAEITNAAVGWANAVGEPEVAKRYLPDILSAK